MIDLIKKNILLTKRLLDFFFWRKILKWDRKMEERGATGTMIEVAVLNVQQTDKSTNIRKLSPAGVSANCLKILLSFLEREEISYFFFVIIKEVRIFIYITISQLIEF